MSFVCIFNWIKIILQFIFDLCLRISWQIGTEHLGEMSPNFVANWHQTLEQKVSEFRGKLAPKTWAKSLRIS